MVPSGQKKSPPPHLFSSEKYVCIHTVDKVCGGWLLFVTQIYIEPQWFPITNSHSNVGGLSGF